MEETPAESMFLMQDWMKLCAAEQRGAIRFWLENDPSPSWRRLIVGLDEIGVHVEANEAAEKIRKYTEPLEGMCTKVCVVRKLGPHLSGVGEASLSALLPVRFPTGLFIPNICAIQILKIRCIGKVNVPIWEGGGARASDLVVVLESL